MLSLYLVGFIVTFTLGVIQAEDSDLTKHLKESEVIPDVISEGVDNLLKVSYDSGVFVDKGAELTPTQVKNEPKIEWDAEDNAFYTLIMVSPDLPSRAEPKYRQGQHWLVVNIPGKDLGSGEVLSEHISVGPSKGTGLHRYVFLLYKQPNKMQFDEKHRKSDSAIGRFKFCAQEFAAKYKLGSPVAANFFQAQYDDYVPILHAHIGLNLND